VDSLRIKAWQRLLKERPMNAECIVEHVECPLPKEIMSGVKKSNKKIIDEMIYFANLNEGEIS